MFNLVDKDLKVATINTLKELMETMFKELKMYYGNIFQSNRDYQKRQKFYIYIFKKGPNGKFWNQKVQ